MPFPLQFYVFLYRSRLVLRCGAVCLQTGIIVLQRTSSIAFLRVDAFLDHSASCVAARRVYLQCYVFYEAPLSALSLHIDWLDELTDVFSRIWEGCSPGICACLYKSLAFYTSRGFFMHWRPLSHIDNLHTSGMLPSRVSVVFYRIMFSVQMCVLLHKMASVTLACDSSLQVGAFAWHVDSFWFASVRICAFLRQSAQFRYELVRFLTNRCGLYNSFFCSAARAQCRGMSLPYKSSVVLHKLLHF